MNERFRQLQEERYGAAIAAAAVETPQTTSEASSPSRLLRELILSNVVPEDNLVIQTDNI